MISSIEEVKKFIYDKSFKRIFILCGKKSFAISGAENIFKNLFTEKELKFFIKIRSSDSSRTSKDYTQYQEF